MKRAARLLVGAGLVLGAILSSPPRPAAALSCSDCINTCVLRTCGFHPTPACQASASQTCRTGTCAGVCS